MLKLLLAIAGLSLLLSCEKKSVSIKTSELLVASNVTLNCDPDRKFDWTALKRGYVKRIRQIKERGLIPIIDIESTYGDAPYYSAVKKVTMNWADQLTAVSEVFNEDGVAMAAFSPESGRGSEYYNSAVLNCRNFKSIDSGFDWFYPVTNAGSPTQKLIGTQYVDEVLDLIHRNNYQFIGEFLFRNYPNNRLAFVYELKDEAENYVPLDGEIGNKIFAFSQKYQIPFHIHYEIEDALLPSLEKMLTKYPGAKVIWAHFGRVGKKNKAQKFNAELIETYLNKFPNLNFDTSCNFIEDRFPPIFGNHTSELWNRKTRQLKPEWKALIIKYPWRFMAALDLGADRNSIKNARHKIRVLRLFLKQFPPEIQNIIAYRAAWKLLFRENID